ncbi:MAG: DUF1634 domain-containing protein, partial [Nanoarchaeota archaeon]|nr:DUF1634 domain-containing protein [Nanoarchaeota archaeon]
MSVKKEWLAVAIAIIVLVILVVGIFYYSAVDTLFSPIIKKGVSSFSKPFQKEFADAICDDSDGGRNPTEEGYVSRHLEGSMNPSLYPDYCADSDTLIEYYCDGSDVE